MIGKDEFVRYHHLINNDHCLELEEDNFRLTDKEAQKIIFDISRCKNAIEFQQLDLEDRDKHLHKLKETGLSIRQISRLTGISFGV